MAITSVISTVTDSIAGLSISGVAIKDINQIPETARMLTPILIPQPDGFVTDINVTFESFGSGGTAKMNMTYNLNYVFLYSEVGSGLGAFAPFSGLVTKLSEILVAIMTNDVVTGAVDLALGNVGNIGVITDPAGNEFWGVLFSLRILEFSQ